MEASAWTWTPSSASGSRHRAEGDLGISLAFFIMFPIYAFAAFLPQVLVIGGSSVTGEWDVSFQETDIATLRTQFLVDGEEPS